MAVTDEAKTTNGSEPAAVAGRDRATASGGEALEWSAMAGLVLMFAQARKEERPAQAQRASGGRHGRFSISRACSLSARVQFELDANETVHVDVLALRREQLLLRIGHVRGIGKNDFTGPGGEFGMLPHGIGH